VNSEVKLEAKLEGEVDKEAADDVDKCGESEEVAIEFAYEGEGQ
jgi:hypothetical protein